MSAVTLTKFKIEFYLPCVFENKSIQTSENFFRAYSDGKSGMFDAFVNQLCWLMRRFQGYRVYQNAEIFWKNLYPQENALKDLVRFKQRS